MEPKLLDPKFHKAGFFGNYFIRPNPVLNAGQEREGHYHYVDHVNMLVRGAYRVFSESKDGVKECWDVRVEDDGFPLFIEIKAECRHKFVALEDNTLSFCMFSKDAAEEKYGEHDVVDIPWTMEVPRV